MKRHTVTWLLGVVMTLSLLSGCQRSHLSEVSPDGVIVAFGDSLTVGVGANRSDSYPSVLQQLTGRQVINAGISGETTAEGAKRLPEVLADTEPELLILLEGGNDILRNHNLTQTRNHLATMIEYAQNQGVQVVLIAVPEKNLFSEQAPLYRELAEEYQVVLIDDMISDLLRTPSYKSDTIHLNARGYRVMAEEIYSVLEREGAF
ncbi:arylesterase [Desulfuromonas acetoxidans]|uniref:Lipolytic enzyme, G-D-S-L n=1 Tax=Desulfuromonas acetoxidans (strain DSM 684 / 11070) TaxID=281689 RepID=Q1JYU5_DESA6|nr:arylesterase [Desulfuromonas acetoxidans]EAT15320.1 lipolytic enzyme, G-D-S-L [Desulfuromonas acetoxidans DSM 684]